MRSIKTEFQKIAIIFLAGFFIYPGLEQIFGSIMAHIVGPLFGFDFPTGKSFDANLSMGFLGGFLVVALGYINEIKPLRKLPFWIHCIIGAVIITGSEWITGRIVNLWLHLGVWDYNWIPLSTPDGQINLFFSLIWLGLSPVCFWLDDQLREVFETIGREKNKKFIYTLYLLSCNLKRMRLDRKFKIKLENQKF